MFTTFAKYILLAMVILVIVGLIAKTFKLALGFALGCLLIAGVLYLLDKIL